MKKKTKSGGRADAQTQARSLEHRRERQDADRSPNRTPQRRVAPPSAHGPWRDPAEEHALTHPPRVPSLLATVAGRPRPRAVPVEGFWRTLR